MKIETAHLKKVLLNPPLIFRYLLILALVCFLVPVLTAEEDGGNGNRKSQLNKGVSAGQHEGREAATRFDTILPVDGRSGSLVAVIRGNEIETATVTPIDLEMKWIAPRPKAVACHR